MCLPLEPAALRVLLRGCYIRQYVQFSIMKVWVCIIIIHSSASWCAMKQSVSLTPVWQRYNSHSPQYHIVSLLSGCRRVWEQYQQRAMPFLLPVGRRNGKWASDVGRRGRGTTGAAVGAARFLLLYAPIKPFANSRRKALNGDGLVDVEELNWWRTKALVMETSTRNQKMYLYTFRL